MESLWSHKQGKSQVINYDGANNLIKNPAKANHYYGIANYIDGGILLWIKRY